jgi:hypothetical protein
VVASVAVVPAAGQEGTTTSPTATQAGEDNSQTPDADTIVQWAEQGKDISSERAESLIDWLNEEGVSELTGTEYQTVSSWLTSQIGSDGTTTTTTPPTTTSPTDSGSDSSSDGESHYQQAQDAIKDGQVSEGELGDAWTMTDRQIGPMTVVAKEFEGGQATFVYRLDKPAQIAYSDDIRYQKGLETPIHTTGTQTSGLHVVQLNTMEAGGREQVGFQAGGTKRWVSNGVEATSDNIVEQVKDWLTVGNVLIAALVGALSVYAFLRTRLWYRSWKHTYTGYSRWF